MSESRVRKAGRGGFSRRDLLKAVPAAGAVAAGAALMPSAGAEVRRANGTCRSCVGHCGITATVRDDRVVRVEGDPSARTGGFICLHGLAIRELVHCPGRVRRPLKKVGGSFEEISWARALEEITDRLKAMRREVGPQALAVQSGWGLVMHPIEPFLLRFCQAFGTPNFVTVGSLCQWTKWIGQALTTGARCQNDAARSRTLVLWGANPSVSLPVAARVVSAASGPDRNLVVIDPVRTETASGATLHLQLRPGTDGVLALGLMHVIVDEGLYNRAYIDRYTVGYDRLLELIVHFDPARVARFTDLPEEDIRRAARMIAGEGPTSIWTGLGVEHHENATQTVRAITILSAICGHVGVPGGAIPQIRPEQRVDGRPLPAVHRPVTPRPVPPPVKAPPVGYDEFPLFEAFNRQAQGNRLATAILEDDPYPVRALILFGSNALIAGPGAERLRRAAEKLSLLVSVDPMLTASGELADYVLPAATFVEGSPPAEGVESAAGNPVLEARHESRSDWQILTGLAAGLGLERYFPWPTLEAARAEPVVPYMPPSRTLHADDSVTASGVRPRFPSASGKIEIYSRTLEQFGYDPLPVWRPPTRRPETTGGEFPLILVTGPRTRAYINSQFRQIPSVASKMPRPLAQVNPNVAERAGLGEGDSVAVVSPHGRVVMRVKVTSRVRPDCVVVPSGWSEANANLLTHDGTLDPITGFPALRSGVCRLERQTA